MEDNFIDINFVCHSYINNASIFISILLSRWDRENLVFSRCRHLQATEEDQTIFIRRELSTSLIVTRRGSWKLWSFLEFCAGEEFRMQRHSWYRTCTVLIELTSRFGISLLPNRKDNNIVTIKNFLWNLM